MHGIGNDWDGMLAAEFEKEYYGKLLAFLAEEYETHRIYSAAAGCFQCAPLFFLCGHESGDFRAGSVSPGRSGARALLFGQPRSENPTVTSQYL